MKKILLASGFFNPADFDPAEWVKIVKEAGIKIKAARLFQDRSNVEFTTMNNGVLLQIPDIPPGEFDLIVELEL